MTTDLQILIPILFAVISLIVVASYYFSEKGRPSSHAKTYGSKYGRDGKEVLPSFVLKLAFSMLAIIGIIWGFFKIQPLVVRNLTSHRFGVAENEQRIQDAVSEALKQAGPVEPVGAATGLTYGLAKVEDVFSFSLVPGETSGPVKPLAHQAIMWGPPHLLNHFTVLANGVPMMAEGIRTNMNSANVAYSFTPIGKARVDIWVAVGVPPPKR